MAAPSGIGNWQLAIDNILNAAAKSRHLNDFSELKTNEKRVEFIFKHRFLKKVEWLDVYFESCKELHRKMAELSKMWKMKGNKFFQQKNYNASIEAFTQSCVAAEKGSSDYAISLGNRSAALFHLNENKSCLRDINRALEKGFPDASRHKLLLRKVATLVRQGKRKEAEKNLKTLEEFMNTEKFGLTGEKKAEFLKEIDSYKSMMENLKSEEVHETDEENEVPAFFKGGHEVIRQASESVNLRVTPEKGRFLQAKTPIPKGSVIIVERPFAAVLLPDHYETHCQYCFRKLPKDPIGCSKCTSVRFCNETCCTKAWEQFHQTECHYQDLLHSVGIAHLSLRIVVTAKLTYLLDFLKDPSRYRCSEDQKGLNKEGVFDRSYLTVYDLVTHEEQTELPDMFQYSLTASLLVMILVHSGFFDEVLNPAEAESFFKRSLLKNVKEEVDVPLPVLSIGGLLLRHILQLVCNGHAVTSLLPALANKDLNNENTSCVEDIEQVRIATGIFPTASLMNHSCDANIVSSFIGDTLIVKTLRDLAEGDEIFNCYGPHYLRMDVKKRQEILSSQYFFQCDCHACASALNCNERFRAFKCRVCAGIMKGKSCLECGELIEDSTLREIEEKDKELQALFDCAVRLINAGDYSSALEKLGDCQEERHKLLYKDHRDLAHGEDAISRCLASLGYFSESADHLIQSVRFAEMLFGETSAEYAHELQKLAEVLFKAERFSECLDVCVRAYDLFSNLYSDQHEAVQEIKSLQIATEMALMPAMNG